MKTIEGQHYLWKGRTVLDEQVSLLIEHISRFAIITMEYFHVLDLLRDKLYYIKLYYFFQNGYSLEEALEETTFFYSKTVYLDDLPLFEDI